MGEVSHFPTYQPHREYNPLEPLYYESFCACGGILRIRAYHKDLLPVIRSWEEGHNPGRGGHYHVSKLEAAKARSALKESAFGKAKQNGIIPESEEFERIDWDSKKIGVSNEEVYGE